MTEAEWRACETPGVMWEYLRTREITGDRKPRLFMVACARRIWHLVVDPRSREAISIAERFADGLATEEERMNSERAARHAADDAEAAVDPFVEVTDEEVVELPGCHSAMAKSSAADAAARCVMPSERLPAASPAIRERNGFVAAAAGDAVGAVIDAALAVEHSEIAEQTACASERAAQAALLRDIFGNPFRPVSLSPEWRTDTAVTLAQQMYESRDFSAMPILADVLQDAGCDSADTLAHCRGLGPHVRGCWVVDLVLEKE
jgi:hypothetical protein